MISSKMLGKTIKNLNNLKKNPEKEYILWPNRLDKVEQFEDYIQGIYNGKEKT